MMVYSMIAVSLILAAVPAQVLSVRVGCTVMAGPGTCEPMSTSKALISTPTGNAMASDIHAAVENDYKAFRHNCQKIRESIPEVMNLSVSLFPTARGDKFNLLIKWITNGHSGGYEIRVQRILPSPGLKPRIDHISKIEDPAVTSVILKNVHSYPRPDDGLVKLQVQVKVIGGSECAELNFTLPLFCTSLIYNRQCLQPIEQGKVNLSEFKVNTTLLSDGVHDLQQMSLHLSWEKSNKSLMIALSTQGQSIDCTMPDRDPPCFITRGTNSLTISPLNITARYNITLHTFDPSPCHHNLPHLFNGCGNWCCQKCYLPIDTESITTTQVPQSTPTPSVETQASHPSPEAQSPQSTPTPSVETQASRPSPEVQSPQSTPTPTPSAEIQASHPSPETRALHSTTSLELHITTTQGTSHDSRSAAQLHRKSDGVGTVAVATAVPLVFVLVAVITLLTSVVLCKVTKKFQHSFPPTQVITNSNTPSVNTHTPPDSVTIELPPISQTHTITNSSLTQKTPSIKHSALVLYSPHTPEKEIEDIVGTLVGGLCQCGIKAKSPDTCFSDNISAWLEEEIVKNSTVLLVCNDALKVDWESKRPSKLVVSLKQLLLGSLLDKGLSNFATVFMSGYAESKYVPSTYLKPQSQFIVQDFDDIVQISHFVHQIPTYTTSF